MMNLFDEKNHALIKDHLETFDYEFSDDEKKAILSSLFNIARSDDEYHPKEKELLKDISAIIGYDFDDFSKGHHLELDDNQINEILKGLGEGQKDWFVITAFLMIYADGVALMQEYFKLESYFEKMGILKERWQEIINKTEEFFKTKED
jgi:hypothetical protein